MTPYPLQLHPFLRGGHSLPFTPVTQNQRLAGDQGQAHMSPQRNQQEEAEPVVNILKPCHGKSDA